MRPVVKRPVVRLGNLFNPRTARKPGPGEVGERFRQYGERMRKEAMDEMEAREEKQNVAARSRHEFIEGMNTAFKDTFGIDFSTAQNIELLATRGQAGEERIVEILKRNNIKVKASEYVKIIIMAVGEFRKLLKKPANWPKESVQ